MGNSQEELRARNVYHMCTTKRSLHKELARVLRGVQRVPTLLLQNPEVPLTSMQLSRYCILDSEPLHDLRGHLANKHHHRLSDTPRCTRSLSSCGTEREA